MKLFAMPTAVLLSLSLCASCSQDKSEPTLQQEQIAQEKTPDYSMDSFRFYDLRVTGGIRNGSAAAYVTITNTGSTPDTLTGASSPACGITEIHEMVDVDGVKTMRSTGHLPVPPSGSAVLKPGGTHIMLMNLKESLHKNDSVDVVLHFAQKGNVTLRALVR